MSIFTPEMLEYVPAGQLVHLDEPAAERFSRVEDQVRSLTFK